MGKLSGIISDRLRSGSIPADAVWAARLEVDDRPNPGAVRHGWGRPLGAGHHRDGTTTK